MANIGLIVRAASEVSALPLNWVPEPLGKRTAVEAIVQGCVSKKDPSLFLELSVETPEESEHPRTISVSGVWGERELAVIKHICQTLGARFYDAEASEFINL